MTAETNNFPPNTIRVIIVDDHPLYRRGLQNVIEQADNIKIVAVSEDGKQALEIITQYQPDIVLLDVNLPEMNGLQVSRQLYQNSAFRGRIIILTAHHDEEQVLHALRSGAAAYDSKNIHANDLIQLIQDVHTGYYVIQNERMSATEKDAWLENRIQDSTPYYEDEEGHFIPLSPREMQILEHVTAGLINKQIAKKLGISQQTVKNHMTSILRKLNVKDRTQAAIIALRRGWVRLDEQPNEEQP